MKSVLTMRRFMRIFLTITVAVSFFTMQAQESGLVNNIVKIIEDKARKHYDTFVKKDLPELLKNPKNVQKYSNLPSWEDLSGTKETKLREILNVVPLEELALIMDSVYLQEYYAKAFGNPIVSWFIAPKDHLSEIYMEVNAAQEQEGKVRDFVGAAYAWAEEQLKSKKLLDILDQLTAKKLFDRIPEILKALQNSEQIHTIINEQNIEYASQIAEKLGVSPEIKESVEQQKKIIPIMHMLIDTAQKRGFSPNQSYKEHLRNTLKNFSDGELTLLRASEILQLSYAYEADKNTYTFKTPFEYLAGALGQEWVQQFHERTFFNKDLDNILTNKREPIVILPFIPAFEYLQITDKRVLGSLLAGIGSQLNTLHKTHTNQLSNGLQWLFTRQFSGYNLPEKQLQQYLDSPTQIKTTEIETLSLPNTLAVFWLNCYKSPSTYNDEYRAFIRTIANSIDKNFIQNSNPQGTSNISDADIVSAFGNIPSADALNVLLVAACERFKIPYTATPISKIELPKQREKYSITRMAFNGDGSKLTIFAPCVIFLDKNYLYGADPLSGKITNSQSFQ